MKEFTLKTGGNAGKGNITRQILDFLIYDGDSKLYTNGEITMNDVVEKIKMHNLSGFLVAQGYKKMVTN